MLSQTYRLSDHCHRYLRSVRSTKKGQYRLSIKLTTSSHKDTRASDEHVETAIVFTDVSYSRSDPSGLGHHHCVIFLINHRRFSHRSPGVRIHRVPLEFSTEERGGCAGHITVGIHRSDAGESGVPEAGV